MGYCGDIISILESRSGMFWSINVKALMSCRTIDVLYAGAAKPVATD